jgi:hypothetical protein
MTDKLSIQNEMRQFDTKNRDFYDELTDEEKKKFSPFLMIRWGAGVESSADFQEWYIRAVNERLNHNFFELGKHPKMQWLLATTVSPGMGTQRHYWQPTKKREGGGNNKLVKFLTTLRPELKQDEIELLAAVNDVKTVKEWARRAGYTEQDIKRELG